MKAFFVVVVALLAALIAPAHAAVLVWGGNLSSSQEIPANPSTATGFGTVRYDDSTNVLTIDLSWTGLTGDATRGHIHCCVTAPPGNAGIALDFWNAPAPRPASGSFSATYDLDLLNPFTVAFTAANGGTTAGAFAAFQAAMDAMIPGNNNTARAYFNLHTAANPGGEIRGNISAIPEPSSAMLLVAGLGALLLGARRARAHMTG